MHAGTHPFGGGADEEGKAQAQRTRAEQLDGSCTPT